MPVPGLEQRSGVQSRHCEILLAQGPPNGAMSRRRARRRLAFRRYLRGHHRHGFRHRHFLPRRAARLWEWRP